MEKEVPCSLFSLPGPADIYCVCGARAPGERQGRSGRSWTERGGGVPAASGRVARTSPSLPRLPPHLRAFRRARPHLSTQRKSSPSSPRRVPPPAFGSSRAAAAGAWAPSRALSRLALLARHHTCRQNRNGSLPPPPPSRPSVPGAFGLCAGAETELTSAQGADARGACLRALLRDREEQEGQGRGARTWNRAAQRGRHSQLVTNEPLFSGRTLGSKWL